MQNFLSDEEKMKDFKKLSKNEFLDSYSYLTEEEYDNTKKLYNSLLDKIKSYDEIKIRQEELQTKLKKIENQILNMIPNNISKENFSNLINEIRYDYHEKDNIENREINMLNAFKQNNIKLCNTYLTKGVSPDKIFQYIRNVGYNNFCLDQQEFFNQNFKTKIITKEQFNNLYQKFENKQAFTKEELGKFLIKENGIWITTQIVEASLDIDFDYLYTEMSTLDSLFQRLGRCYRSREYDGQDANVHIYIENMSGIKYIYDEEINKISIDLLKKYDGMMLDENTKVNLVDKLYSEDMLKNSKFLKRFKSGINILDNIIDYQTGKKEAQKLLRNIENVNIIPKQIYEENLKLFEYYAKEVNYKERNRIKREIDKLTISISQSQQRKLLDRLTKNPYIKELLIADLKYDDNIGLLLKKDEEYEENEKFL